MSEEKEIIDQSNTANAIESMLGLPTGSTLKRSAFTLTPMLTKAVVEKTEVLVRDGEMIEKYGELDKTDIVKAGISLEQLERDRFDIRRDSFDVKTIANGILAKLEQDLHEQIAPTPQMYMAASKMVDSLVNCIGRLDDMNRKMRQEEEFRSMSTVQDEGNGTKQMTTGMWIDFIDAVKEAPVQVAAPDPKIRDAKLIE